MIRGEVANPILAVQIQHNRSTADSWRLFAAHRQHVMNLILSSRAVDAARMCVLGAGNCNDLDLAVLANWFTEIHLVDIDYEALSLATNRQPIDESVSIVLHGGVDITGIVEQLATWYGKAPSEPEIEALLRQAGRVAELGVGEPFDVVVSSAVLTQLIDSAVKALGPAHPRLLGLVLAIRTAHIRLLVDLISPGGAGVLVSDLVSSGTCEQLGAVSEDELLDLTKRLVIQRNFFTGVNPFVVGAILQEDPHIAPHITKVALRKPWRWRIGPKKTHLVYGFTFRKV